MRAPSARPVARRAPAGFYPANEMFAHVLMAGCEIVCTACSTDGRLPLPRAENYSAAVEEFLERHRLCQAALPPSEARVRRDTRARKGAA